ncbi:type II toxin-antitoxin system VapC family toxin [Candidatus Saganbacteria bacterium]|nr:type II toxin-antitoxin system VapC family toxin [Candidatus Saganbacteria bacterium]
MYLIDTCIFLEILLDQKKSADCERLLKKIKDGKVKGYVTAFSLHSIEVILSRFKKMTALELFLEDVLTLTNLEIIYTDIVDELKIVKNMRDSPLDFDDSMQYYVAKTRSLKLVSFDKDFDQTDLKRIEPQFI